MALSFSRWARFAIVLCAFGAVGASQPAMAAATTDAKPKAKVTRTATATADAKPLVQPTPKAKPLVQPTPKAKPPVQPTPKAKPPVKPAPKAKRKSKSAGRTTGGVTIESPAQGTIVRPGSYVKVKVRPDASLNAARASMLVGTWEELVSIVDEVPPFDLVLPIEQKWSGPLRLMWSVQSSRGKVVGSGELVVNVVPLELPVSIAVTDPVRMVAGSHPNNPQERINVRGTYADGTVRDVAGQELGTSFHSSDARVVTVNGEGFLTAGMPGRAVVTVKNGNLSEQVPIDVQPGPKQALPTIDVTSQLDVPAGSVRVDERSSRLAQ